jgi:D-arabinose 1-dehydrogenase-like Zn-dependent alcohol dehydrogenase
MSLESFQYGWFVALFFFGFHLLVLGCVVMKSSYVPNMLGILLIIAGSGYIVDTLRDYKPILEAQGIYVMAGGDFRAFLRLTLQGSLSSKAGGQQFLVFVVKPNQRDLAFVKALLETNKIKPVIDRCYSLPEVPEAMRYLEAGRAKGKIIIKVK